MAQAKRTPTKPNISKPSGVQKPAAKTTSANNIGGQKSSKQVGDSRLNNNSKSTGSGSNIGNKNNIGNNVQIDNSRNNVNINIDNSKDIKINNNRNTVVRRNVNYRPYPRPPYVYGGYRYRCYHPYYYHPYRPFYWGPVWHPWGFFVATLTATAIILIVDNDMPNPSDMAWSYIQVNNSYPFGIEKLQRAPMNIVSRQSLQTNYKQEYYYDEGVFYIKGDGGYTVVAAPVGATIKTLPKGYETVTVDETAGTKNYYYGGTFYEKSANGYTVVPPTAGTVVEHLADGGEEVKMGEITYVKLGETYYQPIQQNGKNMYEVADVEADK